MHARVNRYGQPIGPSIADWSSRPRPPRTELAGRYCRLEPVNPQRHGADLYAAYMEAPDDRDWTYLFDERPEREEDFDSYLTKLAGSQDPLYFTIIATHSNKPLGTTALLRIEPVHGSIEVGGITFSPRAAAERYGFTFEGIFRNAVVYKGRNRDTAWYSITDQEWPRVRSAFEAWLDPGNFDEHGRQKRKLQDLRG
jgi:RimJ/RimL family protein N-acetyltransferase